MPDVQPDERYRRIRRALLGGPRRRYDQREAVGDHDGAFDDVAQLADVRGPRVALQLAYARLRDRVNRLAERGAIDRGRWCMGPAMLSFRC